MKRNLALLVLSIAFALLSAEAVLRLFNIGPDIGTLSTKELLFSANPKLKYTFRPNSTVRFNTSRVKINNSGYRGTEYKTGRPGGDVRRIVCIGDSVTFGVYLEDQETYPAQLEALLNRRQLHGKTWQTLNLGVIGFNTINEVEWLEEKGLGYKPDIVILQYCSNDHSNRSTLDIRIKKHLRRNAPLVSLMMNPVSRILAHSRLFAYIAVRLQNIMAKHSRQTTEPGPGKFGGHIVEQGFQEFKRLSVRYGFQPLVLISPDFEKKERFSDYSRNYEPTADMCRSYGLPFLNMLEIFKRERDSDAQALKLDHIHLSAYGCGFVAECIVNKVLAVSESGT